MKITRKKIALFASIGLLLIAATPALAANTVDIGIENRTGAAVELKLNGPGQNETLFLAADEALELEVIPGVYFYRYFACGRMNSGSFLATASEPSLVLKKCPGLALSNIVIDNQTGDPFIVTLRSTEGVFGYWVPPAGLTIAIPAGGYQVSSTACMSSDDILKASAALPQPLIWTWTCDEVTLTPSAE